MKILLVEDEEIIAVTLKDDLQDAGHDVTYAPDGKSAITILRSQVFDCVLTDVRLPGADGIEVLQAAKAARPDTEVLVMTAFATVEAAVEAMRHGADDYIQKPFLNEAVIERLNRIEEYRAVLDENRRLRAGFEGDTGLPGMIGSSRTMRDVAKVVRTVAKNDASVLIRGESGTGKECVAKALHSLSSRSGETFVALSCGALPETLLETELFGHEKGAFTDAGKQRKGRFELADNGTLFLDDIDDMPLSLQVKLLRVIQEREFERIGGEDTLNVNIRIISATKIALLELVKKGEFREDLYYRLNVVPITLPPLRDREGDVPLLVQHFLRRLGSPRTYTVKTDVIEAMCKYTWPGNVRELENHVAQAIAMAGSSRVLRKEHLLPVDKSRRAALNPAVDLVTLREVLVNVERRHIETVLRSVGGHRTKAASMLGISRKVLWEKLKDYSIE